MRAKSVIIRLRSLLASRRFIACVLAASAPAVVGLSLWSWQLNLVTSVTSLALFLIAALLMQQGRRIFTRFEALHAASEAALRRLESADGETKRDMQAIVQELRSEIAQIEHRVSDQSAIKRVAIEMAEANAFLEQAREQLADQWVLLNGLREDSTRAVEQADARYANHLTIGDLDHLEDMITRHSAQIVTQGLVLDDIRQEIAREHPRVAALSELLEKDVQQKHAHLADAITELRAEIAQIEHRNYSRLDEQIVSYEAAIDAMRGRLVQLEARHVEETSALVEIQEEIANTRQHAALHSSSLARLQADDESLRRTLEAAIDRSTQIAEELTQLRLSLPTADLNDDRYAAVAETLISISQRIDEFDDKLVSSTASNTSKADAG